MNGVDLADVSRVMRAHLGREGCRVEMHDPVTRKDLDVSPAIAAAPDGLLPVLVVAGEALWREATGKGFELDVEIDTNALLGYRLAAIRSGTFTAVMLSSIAAAAQATRHDVLHANSLSLVWEETAARCSETAARMARRPEPGARI